MIDPKLATLREVFADADAAAWKESREWAGLQQRPDSAIDDEVFGFLLDLDAVSAPDSVSQALDVQEPLAGDPDPQPPAVTGDTCSPVEPQTPPAFATHCTSHASPPIEVPAERASQDPELTPLLPATNASPASSAYMRKRAALHGEALDALTLAVRRIREGLEDDADFDDAIKAAPILHKHIEHFERLAAGQAQRDGAQMVHARFGFDKRGEYFVALELVQPDDVTDPLHASE